MTDDEINQLIFAPGFSTADQVTDVSGRGVGMDVVKQNIQSMGGYVEIQSQKGKGTTIRIVLPLTLAILDGMSVKTGDEVFILPLSCVAGQAPSPAPAPASASPAPWPRKLGWSCMRAAPNLRVTGLSHSVTRRADTAA